MTISIETLTPGEAGIVCDLAREIWRQHYPAIIGVEQTEYMLAQRYTPEILAAELTQDGIWWDVLREDTAIVAFASSFVVHESREVKLDKLYVHPGRQRRGLGRRLIDHTARRARDQGCETLVLAVNKHNSAAIAAYLKNGFSIREAVVKDIGGGFVMDDYVMVKDISCRA
jgi:diamine N-acetyltransferase